MLNGFRVCALFGPAFPAYVVGHLVAQGFQPFSFARKLYGVTIKFHSDFANSCNPWTHEANMTPNLLFLTSWDIQSQCPVKYINKPSLRLQFQNCRPSTLLFSDLGLGCNRLNRLNMIELGSTELICRCCDSGCFLSSNLHIVFWGLQAYPCVSTHFDFSINLHIYMYNIRKQYQTKYQTISYIKSHVMVGSLCSQRVWFAVCCCIPRAMLSRYLN